MTVFSKVELQAEQKRLKQLADSLILRSKLIQQIRTHFFSNQFVELETPIRISSPAPELNIDTIETLDKFLIASPELQMKRIMASGIFEDIFQICKCFRKEERGSHHLPEFTMLEWYRKNGTDQTLMTDCENLIRHCSAQIGKPNAIERNGTKIDIKSPFRKIEVADAFETLAGWRPDGNPDPDRFNLDLVEKVEPGLPQDQPVFLCGYPASMASLAQIDPNNPTRALRFELYMGGLELANGFCELTCPKEQRLRFEQEEQARRYQGKPPYTLDEYFLGALALGMPPCAGIALGIDRLIMVLLNAKTIDEVVAFPEGFH